MITLGFQCKGEQRTSQSKKDCITVLVETIFHPPMMGFRKFRWVFWPFSTRIKRYNLFLSSIVIFRWLEQMSFRKHESFVLKKI